MFSSDRIKGFLFILCADFLWALSGSLAKYLFNQAVSPFDLVQVRLTLSALLLGLFLALMRPAQLRIEKSDLLYMAIFGLFGMSMVQFTYMFTISETNVATAIFLQYLAPIFILAYGLLLGREQVTVLKLTALIAATLGGYLILTGQAGGLSITRIGMISGLLSALAFAFYMIYGKYGLSKYPPLTMLFWGMAVGSLAWFFYQPPWVTVAPFHLRDWLFFFYIAVFSTIIPFACFFKGLHLLNPVVAGITSTMEPVLASLIAFLFLGERLSLLQTAGCGLILAAVLFVQVGAEPAPSETEPETAGSEEAI